MHLQTSSRAFLLCALAALGGQAAAEEPSKTRTTSTPVVTPCVATATTGAGAFFDLRPDTAVVVPEGEKPPKGSPVEDYVARGWDYGSNFTLNFCSPVVKEVEDVVGLDKDQWKNVSAYYENKGKVYALGLSDGNLVPRGRKLVLQYSGGSPCGLSDERSNDKRWEVHEGATYKYHEYNDDEESNVSELRRASKDRDDEDDDDDDKPRKDKDKEKDKPKTQRRKSATFSFLCDRDPDTPTAASFVGTDPDECAYFFEVRSMHACSIAEPHKPGSVGPGSVFAIIFFIAVLVYVVGGVFYQRTVAHARGWRQLPNHSLWAGIWSFVVDLFTILTSSCARLVPRRRGYHALSRSPSGRRHSRDAENRLIDQLDEEWDD
ncbi:mannose-6-phosphate receptor binding domain-containing protein [Triangularia verruculosa]|uniref:Mannose-6-phosphate receptor binding domain-containing protein n=1 Tax=Triangularia verruculosa TaxID=2587418 RepID=A0AAN6XKA1_9PEZI|nr:mannose-6-phosphate receptor binding domain-containing protein [Triangularia verruculosa]